MISPFLNPIFIKESPILFKTILKNSKEIERKNVKDQWKGKSNGNMINGNGNMNNNNDDKEEKIRNII